MTVEQIIACLLHHKENIVKKRIVNLKIIELQKEFNCKKTFKNIVKQAIESSAISITQYDKIYSNPTNKFHSLTEYASMKYPTDDALIEYLDCKQKNNELIALKQKDLNILSETINRINQLLSCLNPEELYIVRVFYINQLLDLSRLNRLFCNKFNINYISNQTLSRKKDKAISKMYQIQK